MLFRWMPGRFRRPARAHRVISVAAAAVASKAHVKLLGRRGYVFVIACARTWRLAKGQSVKERVTHLPKKCSRRCLVPLEESGRRRA